MSYILDALKKIEREKVKKSQSGGMSSITGDLFTEQAPRPARSTAGKNSLLIVTVAIIACSATWVMLKDNGKASKKYQPVVAVTPPVPIPPPATPAVVPAPVPIPVAPQIPPPVSLPSVPQPVLRERTVSAVPEAAEQRSEFDQEEPPVKKSRQQKPRTAPVAPRQPELTVQVPADIKLSGIAWQDERAARRAVINGFLLKEGAVVSGFRIADILADRVRFTSSNGNFEIRLNSVGSAEEKR